MYSIISSIYIDLQSFKMISNLYNHDHEDQPSISSSINTSHSHLVLVLHKYIIYMSKCVLVSF